MRLPVGKVPSMAVGQKQREKSAFAPRTCVPPQPLPKLAVLYKNEL